MAWVVNSAVVRRIGKASKSRDRRAARVTIAPWWSLPMIPSASQSPTRDRTSVHHGGTVRTLSTRPGMGPRSSCAPSRWRRGFAWGRQPRERGPPCGFSLSTNRETVAGLIKMACASRTRPRMCSGLHQAWRFSWLDAHTGSVSFMALRCSWCRDSARCWAGGEREPVWPVFRLSSRLRVVRDRPIMAFAMARREISCWFRGYQPYRSSWGSGVSRGFILAPPPCVGPGFSQRANG